MDSTKSPRVLIVDDMPQVRDLFGRFLTMSGMSVSFAEDGLLGLAHARAHLPDIIVCDLDMPRMGGLELCRALRTDPVTRDVPIVVISGRASSPAQGALEAGCDVVLAKPCSQSLLVS